MTLRLRSTSKGECYPSDKQISQNGGSAIVLLAEKLAFHLLIILYLTSRCLARLLSCIQALQAFCMHNPSASKSLVSTALQMLIFSSQKYDAMCRLPGSEASDDLSLQKLMKQQELAEDLKASYK